MLIRQWHLDVPYGRLGGAVAVMKAWAPKSVQLGVPAGVRTRFLPANVGLAAHGSMISSRNLDHLRGSSMMLEG